MNGDPIDSSPPGPPAPAAAPRPSSWPSPVPVSPALALIELGSIARGYPVADAMVKKAPVELLDCRPVSPGKFLVLVAGEVAEVDEAFRCGLAVAADRLVDQMFLPQAHEEVGRAVRAAAGGGRDGVAPGASIDSFAVVETLSVAATILAADAAVKAAGVRIVEMQLARGIGGKGFFSLSGDLADIEAAVEAALEAVAHTMIQGSEIIAAPHEDLLAKLRR
jgi:microcompartment protein CcmL/EutN